MSDYKVGDSVWVKAEVCERPDNSGLECQIGPGEWGMYVFPSGALLPDDIRAEADFKDPLDEAIVDAAEQWHSVWAKRPVPERSGFSSCELWDAVQAKLDSMKPKPMRVEVEVPVVAFPGPRSQADCYLEAATRIEGGYAAGGSCTKEAVTELLRRVAASLASDDDTYLLENHCADCEQFESECICGNG